MLSALLLAACAVALAHAAPESRAASELELRSAYLYNFARFTSWPASAFRSGTAPFTFAVLGDTATAGSLRRLLADKRIENRPVTVLDAGTPAECLGAQVTFVADEHQKALGEILATLDGHPILTVSEIPSFLRMGGMIRLVRVDESLRFEVNRRSTERGGLRLSARLLQLARAVVGA
jgi:hypothetical protein